MRLTVTRNKQQISQLQFNKGPIQIGRHQNCQLLLPSKDVSRHHAVIFATQDGQWILEDLQSANKTYLNGQAVTREVLSDRATIQIADFTIDVDLTEQPGTLSKVQLDDTVFPEARDPQVITRALKDKQAPPLRIEAYRVGSLLRAAEVITEAHGPEHTLEALLSVLLRQFQAERAWCSFRYDPEGPMLIAGGSSADGDPFTLKNKGLLERIKLAREKQRFLLVVHPTQHSSQAGASSVLIIPIIGSKGDFGAFCLESSAGRAPFSLSDLDYALLLSVYLAVILENF